MGSNMDYRKIYVSIVLRAKAEYHDRRQQKRNGHYFEEHHILPRSLGGLDVIANKALLTAREHFICHWLLTKIYPVGTQEHNKMVCAFWNMRATGEFHERYIFSRAYEHLRTSYARIIGKMTSSLQSGCNNSNYGNKWYTNYSTGESKLFAQQPDDHHWVPGRYVYNGQTQSILYLYNGNGVCRPPKFLANPKRKQPMIHQHEKAEQSIRRARELWDEYHSSDCASLSDFSRRKNRSRSRMRVIFNKFIPIFSSCSVSKHSFKPDRNLIGVYK